MIIMYRLMQSEAQKHNIIDVKKDDENLAYLIKTTRMSLSCKTNYWIF